MKDKEQLLWDYIDGSLSSDEIMMVEKKLAEDLSFTQLYNELSDFDMELGIIQTTLEPIDLIAQTKKQLAKSQRSKNHNINLRPFFIFVSVISVLFFAINNLPIESSETIITYMDGISNSALLSWFNNIKINASYLVIMMSVPALYFIDRLFSKGIRYSAVMV